MSARQFPAGLDLLMQDWTAQTYRFMLLDSTAAPDPSADTYVADVSADELADGSYARQAAAGKARAAVLPASALDVGYVRFDCTNPSWVTLAGGEQVGWVVLFRLVTTDADSPLVLAWRVAWTTDGTTWTPQVAATGVWQAATVCTTAFG